MQKASYLAGIAFTRAYVGYVHAIAHQLSGFYSLPHGLANAIILPYVLEYYGKSVHKPLAELADYLQLCKQEDSMEQKANHLIYAIKELNRKMEIPDKVSCINETDLKINGRKSIKRSEPTLSGSENFRREGYTSYLSINKTMI
ncbi:Alcohol dehydrogenase 2 [Halalkalibacter krulwichiae]|uniref:Alcohol dehydrogenase 2 n=2 Tax=Halalkalibacter krulwichiae TaxID=199441 RepID=A0A1X9MAS5_9BACI|nr:Alcohol dehydrogenase 2 [Halalkalibacter krulwichiae]